MLTTTPTPLSSVAPEHLLTVPCRFCGDETQIENRAACAHCQELGLALAADGLLAIRAPLMRQALALYRERGYTVEVMARGHWFAALVNGKRVSIHGSREDSRTKSPRFVWGVLPGRKGASKWKLEELSDVYHLLGETEDGEVRSWIIPSAIVSGRSQIAVPVTSESTRWNEYREAWQVLDP